MFVTKHMLLGIIAMILAPIIVVTALIINTTTQQQGAGGDGEVWSIEINGEVDEKDKVTLDVTGDVNISGLEGTKTDDSIYVSGSGNASMGTTNTDSASLPVMAADWAEKIARNNKYNIGKKIVDGCPICKTRKADCFNSESLVWAAYVHGAKLAKECDETVGVKPKWWKEKGFKNKGQIPLKKLKKGDVILASNRVEIYDGDGGTIGARALSPTGEGPKTIAIYSDDKALYQLRTHGSYKVLRLKKNRTATSSDRTGKAVNGIGGETKQVKALFTSYNNTDNAMEGGNGYAGPKDLYKKLTGFTAKGGLREDFWNRQIPECAIPAKAFSNPYLEYGTTVTPVNVKGVAADKKTKLESTTYLGMDCGGAIKVENGVYHFDIFYDRENYAKNSHGTATGEAILNGSAVTRTMNATLNGKIDGKEITFTGNIDGKPVDATGTIKKKGDKWIIRASGTAGISSSTYSTGELDWPLKGSGDIWRGWGVWTNTSGAGHYHGGLDIGQPRGSDVLAADGGEVIGTTTLANGKSLGLCITVKHSKYITRYQHLDKILVKVGDQVSKGEKIGTVGGSFCGSLTGCSVHLHFEVWRNKVYEDCWKQGKTYVNEYAPEWGCGESYRGATVDPLLVLPENKKMKDWRGFKKKKGRYKGGGHYGNEEQGEQYIRKWE